MDVNKLCSDVAEGGELCRLRRRKQAIISVNSCLAKTFIA